MCFLGNHSCNFLFTANLYSKYKLDKKNRRCTQYTFVLVKEKDSSLQSSLSPNPRPDPCFIPLGGWQQFVLTLALLVGSSRDDDSQVG
jgi:hypothetical protein